MDNLNETITQIERCIDSGCDPVIAQRLLERCLAVLYAIERGHEARLMAGVFGIIAQVRQSPVLHDDAHVVADALEDLMDLVDIARSTQVSCEAESVSPGPRCETHGP